METTATVNTNGTQDASIVELRAKARAAFGGGTWIAAARKAEIVAALESGVAPGVKVHDGREQAASFDEARAREIAREEIAKAPKTGGDSLTIKIPALGKSTTISGKVHAMFPRLVQYAARGTRTWIAGPAGSGKTTCAEKAAAAAGYEKVFVVTPSMTRYDVLGYKSADGTTVETQLSSWAKFEGDAAMILDEVDGWAEGAQLAANTALANGFVVLPDGPVDVTHGGKFRKWIVATANTWGMGANATYVGRRKLDGAFLNRFSAKLGWEYDLAFERDLAMAYVPEGASTTVRAGAELLVTRIQKARAYVDSKGIQVIISPRQTFDAVIGLACGDSDAELWSEIILGGCTDAQKADIRAAAK